MWYIQFLQNNIVSSSPITFCGLISIQSGSSVRWWNRFNNWQ